MLNEFERVEHIRDVYNKLNFFPLIPINEDKKPKCKWKDDSNYIYSNNLANNLNHLGFGLITGEASKIMVVDLDNKNGKEGSKEFQNLLDELELQVSTLKVKTPNNGYHLYFKYREGLKNTSDILDGIDIRTQGGYIIAPYSRVKDGVYEIVKLQEVQEMDDKLFNKLKELCNKNKNKDSQGTTDTKLNEILNIDFTKVGEGSRDTTLFNYIINFAEYKAKTIDRDTLLSEAHMQNNKMPIPLSSEEVDQKVDSAITKLIKKTDKSSEYELLEDERGIYYTTFEGGYKKKYLTNFNILDCIITKKLDGSNNIKMHLKTIDLDKEDVIEGDADKIFSDSRNFRKLLGLYFTFDGNGTDLSKLKSWILKNKAKEVIEENINPLKIVTSNEYVELGIGEEKKFIVDGLVYEKSLGFIIAPPKVGKTTFSYLLARSIATGEDFAEHKVNGKRNVLYVLVEGSLNALVRRFKTPNNFYILEDKRFNWEEYKNLVISFIKENNIEVVVLDSLYRLTNLDMTKSIALKPFLEELDILSTELGCTFLIPHHTNRMELTENHQNKVAGSSDIVRAGEFFIFLDKTKKQDEEDEENFYLTNEEINQKPLEMTMTKHDYRYGKTGFNKYKIEIDMHNGKINHERFKLDGKKANTEDRLEDLINYTEDILPKIAKENDGKINKSILTDAIACEYADLTKATITRFYIKGIFDHLEKRNIIQKGKRYEYNINEKYAKELIIVDEI